MEQIQAKSLEMAEYFVEFCNEHNLLCYLFHGTMILISLCQEKIMRNLLSYGHRKLNISILCQRVIINLLTVTFLLL